MEASRSAGFAGGLFELGDALRAHRLDDAAKLLDLFAEPGQLFFAHGVVLGVARLDVGFLELLEHAALPAVLARPGVDQPGIETLGLGAQERQIVDVRSLCRASDYAA